jgi:hypothetical protein
LEKENLDENISPSINHQNNIIESNISIQDSLNEEDYYQNEIYNNTISEDENFLIKENNNI